MENALTLFGAGGGQITRPQQQSQDGGALVEVEQQRAIAETQAAMIISKRFPRDQIAAVDRILNACTRPTLAEAALYQYSKGGSDITGPSIRLAEAMAQSWGNLQFGIRELEQRQGASTVEAFAWDVETNVRQVKVFQVKHERSTKKGRYALEDSRDIYELTANQGARRLRACILGIIPGDVVEAAVRQCESTLKTKAEVTPERIATLVEKFAEYNVSKSQIEKRIQRRIDAMTPALMVSLGKVYNSLKDGMSTPADWFEVAQQVDAPQSLKDKLKTASEPRSTPPPTTDMPPTTTDDPGPASAIQEQSAEAKDERREEYINLRSAGFSTFVHKHWGRIHSDQFSDEHRAEIREKWAKLYPETPWPAKAGENSAEPVKAVETGNGKVWCSRQGQFKPVGVCEQKCSYRGTCEDYAKYAAGAQAPKDAEKMISCPDEDLQMVPVTMCETCQAREGCPAWDDGVQE